MSELEWRRRWKPDLHAQSWHSLSVGGSSYLVKCHFESSGSYSILLSDRKFVWHEHLDSEQLKKRSKKLNPSVEAPASKLVDHLRDQLELNGSTAKFVATRREDVLLVTMNSKLAGLSFVWKFYTSLATTDMVTEHLTLPLLTMVSEQLRREEHLIKILQAKDKEIADLRAQGAKCTRQMVEEEGHIETVPFDQTVFYNNMDTSKEFEECVRQNGLGAFNSQGQNLYRGIMAKQAWINRIPEEASEGESLADEVQVPSGSEPAPGQSWANRIPPSVAQTGVGTHSSPIKTPKKGAAASPANSPSPRKANTTPDPSPVKDTELLRRQALERRLQEEEAKKGQKPKKKKIRF